MVVSKIPKLRLQNPKPAEDVTVAIYLDVYILMWPATKAVIYLNYNVIIFTYKYLRLVH